jgi:hypothetical protein
VAAGWRALIEEAGKGSGEKQRELCNTQKEKIII